MQVYIDNDKNTVSVVQSVASASTMISSVATQAKEYILSKFPKNYFKHVYINTSQTITQQSYNDKYNKTANKIRYPSMAVTPVMSLDDPIGAMEKSMHLSSPNLYLRKDISRTQNKLVVDPERQFSIYYTCDYITTNFDFSITTNTYIQNVDIAHYLKSRFQLGFFQYLNDCKVQTEIPKSLITMVADMMNYDLNDADDMDSLRLYLIGTSRTNEAIQKKVNTGTGKQCFFLNQNENFLVLFTDLDCPPSVIRESQTEGEYQINFRLQVSCWIPNAFILNIDKNRLKQLSGDTISYLESDENQQEAGILTVDVYSRDIFTKNDTIYFSDSAGSQQIGQLVFYETFTHEFGKNLNEITVLYDRKSEFSKIYSYAIEEGGSSKETYIKLTITNKKSLRDIIGKYYNRRYYHLDANGFQKTEAHRLTDNILTEDMIINNYFEALKRKESPDPLVIGLPTGAVDLSSLIHLALYTNKGKVDPDKYTVDYEHLTVSFGNIPELNESDLVVALYVNRLAFESLKKAYEKDTFYFGSNFLTTIYTKFLENDAATNRDVEKPTKIVVRSFSNSKEKNSSDLERALRVNTAYGIGYISLLNEEQNNGNWLEISVGVDEDDDPITKSYKENSYRVCLGLDENDEPIIRYLETKEA